MRENDVLLPLTDLQTSLKSIKYVYLKKENRPFLHKVYRNYSCYAHTSNKLRKVQHVENSSLVIKEAVHQ